MDIFKELWQELPKTARTTAGIIFLVFSVLCLWACLTHMPTIDQEEDIPDLYGPPSFSLIQ